MSFTITIALLAIIPLAIILYDMLPARRAIIATYVISWLFLPSATITIIGVPDFGKTSATNFAVLLGAMLYHWGRFWELRFSWVDCIALIWAVTPGISSLANGLGIYDACSETFTHAVFWLIPYLIGRVFFRDAAAMQEIGVGIVLGALVYIPFCLYEIRMSPQLNEIVYGFRQNAYLRNYRFGGYRPLVFMESGLMVGIWMASATAISFWFWQTRCIRQIGNLPMVGIFVVLLAMTVLCKALYAILLLIAVLGILTSARHLRTAIPMLLLMLAIPTYLAVRASNTLPRAVVTKEARELFNADRAQSLDARLMQEDLFAEHALQRPVFGWGGWNRSWPYDHYIGKQTVRGVDGLWVITLGRNGLFGVFALFAALLMPIITFVRRVSPWKWSEHGFEAASVLAAIVLLFACDCLLNSMYNPLFLVICGALVTFEAPAPAGYQQKYVIPRRRLTPGNLALDDQSPAAQA